MRISILAEPPDLSAYVGEILRTWGLPIHRTIDAGALAGLDPRVDPVTICASPPAGRHPALVDYARRGGILLCFLPTGELAGAAGIRVSSEPGLPLRLRMTAFPSAGLAGELLPVTGRAAIHAADPGCRVLGYLSHPGCFEGEFPAITEAVVDRGRILAFAFDLPLCVMWLRQGDPGRAERIPPADRCARPSHLAAEIGPGDCGWVPYADLLARLLVDLVRSRLPGPTPRLRHLPGAARGILLYSGDEDGAEVAWNEEELDAVAAAGGRMNLYLIPTGTKSTPEDARRYTDRGDLGPHPNLRPLDGRPVGERIREFERQIRMFREMFGIAPRSLRNHCTAWAGYTEPAESMERLGIAMDANYCSGTYLRDRLPSPYAGFGAAMPMRFCRPDGRLIQVFQQHTHHMDDVMFHPSVDYSYKISPEPYEGIVDRIYADITSRHQTPFAVCIHPSNWVKFSRPQGQALLRLAKDRAMPIWSFDQWCLFWQARDGWEFQDVGWEEGRLRFRAEGGIARDDLGIDIPDRAEGKCLLRIHLDSKPVTAQVEASAGEGVSVVGLPGGRTSVEVVAEYG